MGNHTNLQGDKAYASEDGFETRPNNRGDFDLIWATAVETAAYPRRKGAVTPGVLPDA